MNAHPKENCDENDDSAKLPVTGQYALPQGDRKLSIKRLHLRFWERAIP